MRAIDVKPFVGSRDFGVSIDFYVALGWTLNFRQADIAELELGGCRFYLQRYYQRQWCNNSMLHITVDDAQAWFEHVSRVLEKRNYGAARVKAPERAGYSSLVTYVWDPVGVLLHFAQPDDAPMGSA
jgi:hypothetical protein